MIKEHINVVLGSIVALAFASVVYASEPSSIYTNYIEEGIKAFESHHDEESSRYFQWALVIDPSAKEPAKYLKKLSERQDLPSDVPATDAYFPYFDEMLLKGVAAMERKDYEEARQYFYTAHLMDRNNPKPLEYINLLKRFQDERVVYVQTPRVKAGDVQKDLPVVERPAVKPQTVGKSVSVVKSVPVVKSEPATVLPVNKVVSASVSSAAASSTAPVSKATAPASLKSVAPVSIKEKKVISVLSLDEVIQNSIGGRAALKLDMGASVVLEGKNIRRFLVVNEGPVLVKIITRDQIQLDGLKIGSTFIHIWDDTGRRTVYVEVLFPEIAPSEAVQPEADLEHSKPFRVRYSNDWSSYYYGNDVMGLNRTSLSFQQSAGFEGATPYGFLDASVGMAGLHPITNVTTYSMGLKDIPIDGFTALTVRLFDVSRTISPYTLPGASLRGVLLDTRFFENNVALSLVHGQERSVFGYFTGGGARLSQSYINGMKITLFPKDPRKHYALNYAEGYGADHLSTAASKVVSVEGEQQFGRARINGELARDNAHNALVSGLKWENGAFRTGINVRKVDLGFSTVTGAANGQGEKGLSWIMALDRQGLLASTAVEVYQGQANPNPQNPGAYNYNLNGRVFIPMANEVSMDMSTNYVETPQDISPRTYFSGDVRLAKLVEIWGKRKLDMYVRNSYQRSHYAETPLSDYERVGVTTGIAVPLIGALRATASYEYSWLYEPLSGGRYNPGVLSTGLTYSHDLTTKLTGTWSAAYRDEQGIGGTNSFLSGEDSMVGTMSLTYKMNKDTDLYLDTRLSNILSQTDINPSYNDLDIRLGMRANWGTPFYWDPKGTIEGRVFKDKNGNGKLDKDEEGIPGVHIKIGNSEVTTSSTGWYHQVLRAKRAIVAPVLETIPPGYVFSTPTFSRANVREGLRDRVDFGLTTQSGIFGIVYVDKNGNGTPDKGDIFKNRIKILLDGKSVQMTDSNGVYFFKNISPGKHVISIDMVTLSPDLMPQIKVRNELTVVEGSTYVFHIPMKIKETPAEPSK